MFTYHVSPQQSEACPIFLSIRILGNTLTAFYDERQYSKYARLPLFGRFFDSPSHQVGLCVSDYVMQSGASFIYNFDKEHSMHHREKNEISNLHSHVKFPEVTLHHGKLTQKTLRIFFKSLKKCLKRSNLDTSFLTKNARNDLIKNYSEFLKNHHYLHLNNSYNNIPTAMEHIASLSRDNTLKCIENKPSTPALTSIPLTSITTPNNMMFGVTSIALIGLFAKIFCRRSQCSNNMESSNNDSRTLRARKST